MAVWINEFHYDNVGTDTGEFVELAGTAGTNLSGWSLVRYNGTVPSAAVVYTSPGSITLGGVIPDQQNGYGTLSFALPQDGLQNGGNDGFALVDAGGTVVQLLSYEGVFTASGGPANGLTSVDIGVSEPGTDAAGGALALVGSGSVYADFTWAKLPANTAGAVNAGQSFGIVTGTSISIGDASVAEGNDGTTLLVFTVTRSSNADDFTIDFATADGTAAAGSDFLAAAGTLSFTAGGALTQQVEVMVNGDVLAELDETLTVTLSNLVGGGTVTDGSGTGTIVNDDIAFTEIAAIQGAGHKSSFVGGGSVGTGGNSGAIRVNVEGVVTAIAANGFYMQDATPDGDVNTSDGIFVFTNTSGANYLAGRALAVGTTVQILGARVDEFRPGSDLTITELSIASTITGSSLVDLGGHVEIAPVVLGVDRIIPTGAIASTSFATYDPATYAADFWESLEGMLVQVPNPVAVGPTAEFRSRIDDNTAGPPSEEIWVVTPGGFDAASQTGGGGLVIGPTDYNPERIQIDDLSNALDLPNVSVGTVLSSVTGVVNYDFGNYEVLVSNAPTIVTPSPLVPEVTTLTRGTRELTIADYNLENLDAEVENTAAWGSGGVAANGIGGVTGSTSGNSSGTLYNRLGNSDDDVGSGKYAAHAQQIAMNLGAPAILALQEIQDDDGAEISAVLSSDVTLQTLVDMIQATYGIQYAFAYVAPNASNINGGQPNANIRNAFLYQPDVVTLENLFLLDPTNAAFASSRKPLVGEFSFNGQTVTLINVHLNSKGGDGALFGDEQPPVLASETQRIQQAQVINDYVDGLLASNSNALVKVVGDVNDFAFSQPVAVLTGEATGTPVLRDLAEALLPETEQYTYVFEGNSQALDHHLDSDALLAQIQAFDIVHVNAELTSGASDHDPSVALYDFSELGELLDLDGAANTIDGAGGADRILGRGGADTLLGGAGNDSLAGGARDDLLVGGAGDDLLVGGTGRDVFVFATDGGRDRVKDFAPGEDLLDLTAFAAIGVHDLADLRIVLQPNGTTRITFGAGSDASVRLDLGGATLLAEDILFA
jgi:predicted extracellular nuclease